MPSLFRRLVQAIDRASQSSSESRSHETANTPSPIVHRLAELLNEEETLYLERPNSRAHIRLGAMPVADEFGVVPEQPTLSNPRVIAYPPGLNAVARGDDGQFYQIARPGRRVPTGKIEGRGPGERHVLPDPRGWVLLPVTRIPDEDAVALCPVLEESIESIREMYARESARKTCR